MFHKSHKHLDSNFFHSLQNRSVVNTFEIKSTQLPLVSLLLKTADLQQLGADLLGQYGPTSENAGFFEDDALVLDFSRLNDQVAPEDIKNLLDQLSVCHLKPLAFRGGKGAEIQVLKTFGLVEASLDLPRGKAAAKPVATVAHEPLPEVIKEVRVEVPGPATLVIDKPVRSGQKVYARSADLVVLAMVNQGAEVVADGNIHVYAPLRGKAMAGANGNTQARIFSLCLEPELISIAGVYRTSENPLPTNIQGKPAQVRLSNDGQEKLLFEALNS